MLIIISNWRAFILTGSTSQRDAADRLRMHSGVGRIGRMKMLTMSLYESDDSNGEISLSSLFDNPEKIYSGSPHTLEDIAFLAVRGGWPGALNIDKKLSSKQTELYIDEFVESDIQNVDGHRRSAVKMRKVLRSYARFSGASAPNTAIENDVNDISKNTLADYLKVLDDLFITNETTAWNPNLDQERRYRQVIPVISQTRPSLHQCSGQERTTFLMTSRPSALFLKLW